MRTTCVLSLCLFTASAAHPQEAQRAELGRFSDGATVVFVRAGGDWGIEISGGSGPHFNHIHGIVGLEQLDRELYQRLAKGL
jgi:hypothetical protein